MKILNPDPKKKQNNVPNSARKRIVVQAGLAFGTIVLTIVLLFAMTQAWYTNVIQSSGLVFQTEQWGFKGEVSVGPEVISAAPGKSGVIELSIKNDSDDLLFASVNISKEQMTNEMAKRIYFYADTSSEKNGEVRERIYLNDKENYSYLLLSQSQLSLTETSYNDVQLKWEWVYDVLGYYCFGTVKEDTAPVIEDYLRPVTYDLDQATFAEDPEKPEEPEKLETVDGKTTVEQFLAELSKTDGYEKPIDLEKVVEGYYPVEVDEEGKGVWVYLYNYAEIELAIQYDTQQAQLAANPDTAPVTVARLTIVSENAQQTQEAITESEDLVNALTGGESNVIRVDEDLTLDTPLAVKEGQTVLDLGGNTLTSGVTGKDALFKLSQGSSLTLLNGTIESSSGTEVFLLEDSGLTLSNVQVTGADRVMSIRDKNADSVIRLKDCSFTTEGVSIAIFGNGKTTNQRTLLVLENCTIDSGHFGISGNGNATSAGTDIQIIDSQIKGKYTGVFQPQRDSVLHISGSQISGITGLAIKAGEVYIADSIISGIGNADEISPPGESASGFVDTGAGISVETNYGTEITVTVTGQSQVTSVSQAPIVVYDPADDNFRIILETGILTEEELTALEEKLLRTQDENRDIFTGKQQEQAAP